MEVKRVSELSELIIITLIIFLCLVFLFAYFVH